MAVETAVHNAFKEAAQIVMDEYGIKVERVSFDWIDVGTPMEPAALVQSTNIDSVKQY